MQHVLDSAQAENAAKTLDIKFLESRLELFVLLYVYIVQGEFQTKQFQY